MNNLDEDLAARVRHGLNRGAAPELSSEVITGAADHPAPRMTNPARLAGGATAFVAAAAVAALVVAPSLQPAPLFTAAGASAPGALGSAEAISSDMRIGMWVDYNYTAGPDLSTSGGRGNVYQLELSGDVAPRTNEIGSIFGVAGEAVESEYSTPEYPTWVIGAEDGTGPSVTVSWVGTGDWWFNDPTASPVYTCDSLEPACEVIEPIPNDAPSEAEARSLAHELFASTGFDIDEDDITVLADEWQTTATANLVVAGTATALDWVVSWSNTGEISWAYGHSITVKDRGSYGTISATDAVDRLEDGRWWGAAGPEYQGGMIAFAADSVSRTSAPTEGGDDTAPVSPEPDPSVSPDAPTEPVDPTTPVVPEPDPSETPVPVDPETPVTPIDPAPIEPEVVEVTVNEAEATLLLMWDSSGSAWLVPGFAMKMPEGWWSTVVSLVPGVIEIPDPVTFEPYLIEPGTVEVEEPAAP